MKTIFSISLLCVCAVLVPLNAQTAKPDRQVAVTIDDLPAGMADRLPAADVTAMTNKLLGTLRDQKIPVVGFVNEIKLYKPGEVDERIKVLQTWLDYGFELGNHTFSHMKFRFARPYQRLSELVLEIVQKAAPYVKGMVQQRGNRGWSITNQTVSHSPRTPSLLSRRRLRWAQPAIPMTSRSL